MRRFRERWTKFWRNLGVWLTAATFWRTIGIGTIVTAVLLGMAQSFGGEIYKTWGQPLFTQTLLPLLERTATVQVWQLAVLVLLIMVTLIYSRALSANKEENGEVTASMITELEKMSAPMLKALEQSAGDSVAANVLIKKLITAAIAGIENTYGGRIFRGSVWAPDPNDPTNWLCHFADNGLDDEGRSRRFYIGLNSDGTTNRPGVVGTVYRTKTPQLVHYDRSHRRSDNDSFISFPGDVEPYASFVTIPLLASFLGLDHGDQDQSNYTMVYGVICLDSAHTRTFDYDPIMDREGKILLAAAPLLRYIYHLLRWQSRLNTLPLQ
jgi:hypothetical protein